MEAYLKFRAWDKENNIMHQPVSLLSNWDNKFMGYSIKGHQYVYMQYTWFKDKDNKEIYVGDVLGVNKVGGEKESVGQVCFDNDFGAFVIKYTNGGWDYLWNHLITNGNEGKYIIGNIYENPTLLIN